MSTPRNEETRDSRDVAQKIYEDHLPKFLGRAPKLGLEEFRESLRSDDQARRWLHGEFQRNYSDTPDWEGFAAFIDEGLGKKKSAPAFSVPSSTTSEGGGLDDLGFAPAAVQTAAGGPKPPVSGVALDISMDRLRAWSDAGWPSGMTFDSERYRQEAKQVNDRLAEEERQAQRAREMRVGARVNEDGEPESHLMAWAEADGKYVAHPTLFQTKDGIWYEAEDAFEEAKKRDELFWFDSQKEAEEFAAGSWKKPRTAADDEFERRGGAAAEQEAAQRHFYSQMSEERAQRDMQLRAREMQLRQMHQDGVEPYETKLARSQDEVAKATGQVDSIKAQIAQLPQVRKNMAEEMRRLRPNSPGSLIQANVQERMAQLEEAYNENLRQAEHQLGRLRDSPLYRVNESLDRVHELMRDAPDRYRNYTEYVDRVSMYVSGRLGNQLVEDGFTESELEIRGIWTAMNKAALDGDREAYRKAYDDYERVKKMRQEEAARIVEEIDAEIERRRLPPTSRLEALQEKNWAKRNEAEIAALLESKRHYQAVARDFFDIQGAKRIMERDLGDGSAELVQIKVDPLLPPQERVSAYVAAKLQEYSVLTHQLQERGLQGTGRENGALRWWRSLKHVAKGDDPMVRRFDELTSELQVLMPIAMAGRNPMTDSRDSFGGMYMKYALQQLSPSARGTVGETNFQRAAHVVNMLDILQEDRVNPDVDAFVRGEVDRGSQLWSSEDWAQFTGMVTTFGLQFLVGALVGNKILAAGRLPAALAAIKAGHPAAMRLAAAYDDIATGRTLLGSMINSGINYEVTDMMFATDGEGTFWAGALGEMGGEYARKAFGVTLGRFFGNRAGDVVALMVRSLGRGTGELGEEFVQEMIGIHRETLGHAEFMERLDQQFGTLSKASHFVIQTMLMGAAFGAGNEVGRAFNRTARDSYQALTPEEKQAVDKVMAQEKKAWEEQTGASDVDIDEVLGKQQADEQQPKPATEPEPAAEPAAEPVGGADDAGADPAEGEAGEAGGEPGAGDQEADSEVAIDDLARRIAAGETITDPEDLQLQQNKPAELEARLAAIRAEAEPAEATKPPAKGQKTETDGIQEKGQEEAEEVAPPARGILAKGSETTEGGDTYSIQGSDSGDGFYVQGVIGGDRKRLTEDFESLEEAQQAAVKLIDEANKKAPGGAQTKETPQQPVPTEKVTPPASPEGERRGKKQIDLAKRQFVEAKDPLGRLTAIQYFRNNANAGAEVTQEERDFFDQQEAELKKQGYEVTELKGNLWDEGNKMRADFVPDESLPEGVRFIDRVYRPQVLKDGKLVQSADVRVRQGTKKSPEREALVKAVKDAVDLPARRKANAALRAFDKAAIDKAAKGGQQPAGGAQTKETPQQPVPTEPPTGAQAGRQAPASPQETPQQPAPTEPPTSKPAAPAGPAPAINEAEVDTLEKEGAITAKVADRARRYLGGQRTRITTNGYNLALAAANKKRGTKDKPDKPKKKRIYREPKPDDMVVRVPLESIYTDVKRFQMRDTDAGEETVRRIVEDFDPKKLDPLKLWKDPQSGRLFVLAGHSRLKGLRKRGDIADAPAYIYEGISEEEARKIAFESNSQAQANTDTENARVLRETSSPKERKARARELFGKNAQLIYALSFLKPDGKLMDALRSVEAAENVQARNNMKTMAEWIGQARANMPDLTDAHESEMYAWLMEHYNPGSVRMRGKVQKKTEFLDIIGRKVQALDFSPERPLNLQNFVARSDTRQEFEQDIKDAEATIKDLDRQLKEIQERMARDPNVDPTAAAAAIQRITQEQVAARRRLLELKGRLDQLGQAEAAQTNLFGGDPVARQPAEGPKPAKPKPEPESKPVPKKSDAAKAKLEELAKRLGKKKKQEGGARSQNISHDEAREFIEYLEKKYGIKGVLNSMLKRNTMGAFDAFSDFYEAPLVEINTIEPNKRTIIHEYLHPFVTILNENNPALFEAMYQEAIKDPEIREALGQYKDADKREEAVTRHLDKVYRDPRDSTLLRRLFDWLSDFFWKMRNNVGAKLEKLSPTTTVKQLYRVFENYDMLGQQFLQTQTYDAVRQYRILSALQSTIEKNERLIDAIEQDADIDDDQKDQIIRNFQSEIDKATALFEGDINEALTQAEGRIRVGRSEMKIEDISDEDLAEMIDAALEYGQALLEEEGITEDQYVRRMVLEFSEIFEDAFDMTSKQAELLAMEIATDSLQEPVSDNSGTLGEVMQRNAKKEQQTKAATEERNKANAPKKPRSAAGFGQRQGKNTNLAGLEQFQDLDAPQGAKNSRALEILEKIESGEIDRELTVDERVALASYSGRGATGQEGGDVEFYTPKAVIRMMWDLAEKTGILNEDQVRMMEPSVGAGHIIGYAPDKVHQMVADGKATWTAADLPGNPGARIAQVLYPNVRYITNVRNPLTGAEIRGIEALSRASADSKYDLAITNVPFSADTKMDGMNLHDAAVVRSLRMLRPGGIGIFVVPKGLMDKENSDAREAMLEVADFLGHQPLAPKAFDNTDVATDIVVFRRRDNAETDLRARVVAAFSGNAADRVLAVSTGSDEELKKDEVKELNGIAEALGVGFERAIEVVAAHLHLGQVNQSFLNTEYTSADIPDEAVQKMLADYRSSGLGIEEYVEQKKGNPFSVVKHILDSKGSPANVLHAPNRSWKIAIPVNQARGPAMPIHTRWGFRVVEGATSSSDIDFNLHYVGSLPKQQRRKIEPSLRDGRVLFMPKEATPIGSIVRTGDMILKKISYQSNSGLDKMKAMFDRTFADMVVQYLPEGVDPPADKDLKQVTKVIGDALGKVTLNSFLKSSRLYDTAEKRSKDDADRYAQAMDDARTLTQDAMEKVYGSSYRADYQAAARDAMMAYWNAGEQSVFYDLKDELRENGDLSEFEEFLDAADAIIRARNEVNMAGTDLDAVEPRENLKALYQQVRTKGKALNHPMVKYLKGTSRNQYDERFYVLQALDGLTVDESGKAIPKESWGGIFKQRTAAPVDFEVEDAMTLMEEVLRRADLGMSVPVSAVLEYVESNQRIFPKLAKDLPREERAFVQQLTATGDWLVDYSREDQLAVVRTEDYAIGNVAAKLKTLEQAREEAMASGQDVGWHNIEPAIDRLQQIRNTIPEIPVDAIRFDAKAGPVDFKAHVVPFFSDMLGFSVQDKDLVFNKAKGRWSFKIDGGNTATPISRTDGVDVTTKSLLKWWHAQKEVSPKLDERGNVETDKKGKTIYEEDASATNARDKAVAQAFDAWLKKQEYIGDLAREYNDQYAIYRGGDPGSLDLRVPINIAGLRPWQMRAVSKALQRGSLFFNHAVGAGKTFEALVTAREMKARGMANKPLFVVPLKTVEQWVESARMLYPDAKILSITSKNKKEGAAAASTGDYDYVIASYEAWESSLPVSTEAKIAALDQELEPARAVMAELNAIASTGGTEGMTARQALDQLKKLQKDVDKMTKKVEALRNADYGESTALTMEAAGLDALFVDEYHNFKNVFTPKTEYGEIKGASGDGDSERALNMRLAIRHVQGTNSGRNVFPLSGTPVTNSATEIYQVLYATAPKLLEDAGIRSFNDFVNALGVVEAEDVVKMSNEVKGEAVFAGIKNKNQLKRLIAATQDVILQGEMDQILEETGALMPKPVVDDVFIEANPARVFMQYHTMHLAKSVGEVAKQRKKKEIPEAEPIKREIKGLEDTLARLKKEGADPAEIRAYEEQLKDSRDMVQRLGYNALSLYNRIKGGIINTRLFSENLDETAFENSKVGRVADEAAALYLGGEGKVVTKQVDVGKGEMVNMTFLEKDGKLTTTQPGQLFFIDRYQREGFDAAEYYMGSIAEKIASMSSESAESVKRKMYHLSSASSPLSKAKLRAMVASILEPTGDEEADQKKVEDVAQEISSKVDGKLTYRDAAQWLYNHGHIQFLFGGEAMKEGMNLQYTTVAIHHLDMPFRPADYIQRNGRAYRQGNPNSEIHIKTYAVSGGSDVLILQLMRMKQRFIEAVYNEETLDDFSQEAIMESGESVTDSGALLGQLDGMIANTRDPNVRDYVDMRKAAERLENEETRFQSFARAHAQQVQKLEDQAKNLNAVQARLEAAEKLYDRLAELEKKDAAGQFESPYVKGKSGFDELAPDLMDGLKQIARAGTGPWQVVAEALLQPDGQSFRVIGKALHSRPESFLQGSEKMRNLITHEKHDAAEGAAADLSTSYRTLRKAVGRAKGTIKHALKNSREAYNKQEAMLASQRYQDTLQRARDEINGTESLRPIRDRVADAKAAVLAAKPHFERFVEAQGQSAAYANYLARDVLPGQTDEQRKKTLEDFVRAKDAREMGESLPPHPAADPGMASLMGGALMDVGGPGMGAPPSSQGPTVPGNVYETTGKELRYQTRAGQVRGISRAQITRNLAKNLDMRMGETLRAGFRAARFAGKASGTLGMYFPGNGIVRLVAREEAFETFAHEAGHLLDLSKRLEKSKATVNGKVLLPSVDVPISEALAMTGDPDFKKIAEELIAFDAPRVNNAKGYKNLDRKGKLMEATAEFVRQYIVNPAKAYTASPAFYEYFEDLIAGTPMEIALRTARNDYKLWQDQNPALRMQALLNPPEVDRRVSPLMFVAAIPQWLNGLRKGWILTMFDKAWALRDPGRAWRGSTFKGDAAAYSKKLVEGALDRFAGTGDSINAFLARPFRRRVNWVTGEVRLTPSRVKGLFEIIQPFFNEGKMTELTGYLVAKRFKVYFDRGLLTIRGKAATLQDQEVKDVLETIKQFEANHGSDVATEINDFQSMILGLLMDGGIITYDEMVAMRALNPFYVPMDIRTHEDFTRDNSGNAVPINSITLDTSKPLRAIKTLEWTEIGYLGDPIEAIMVNVQKAMSAVNQNSVSWAAVRQFYDLQKNHKDFAGVIQRIPDNKIMVDAQGNPIIKNGTVQKRSPEDEGMVVIAVRSKDAYAYDTDGSAYIKGGGTRETQFEEDKVPDYNDDLSTPGFFSRPMIQYYQIPKQMHVDLTAGTSKIMASSPFVVQKLLRGAADVLRWGAVNASIPFITRNLARDFETATFNAKSGMDAMEWFKQFYQNAVAAVGKGDQKYRMLGIQDEKEWLMMAAGAGLGSSILSVSNQAYAIEDNFSRQSGNKVSSDYGKILRRADRNRMQRALDSLIQLGSQDFFIARLTAATERTTRMAAAETVLKRGGDIQEAAHAYRNASGDWKVGGSAVQQVASMIPFLKAEMYHLRALWRSGVEAMDNPKRRKHFLLAVRRSVIITMARAIFLALGFPGEDDETRRRRRVAYLQLPGYRRYGYVTYPMPGGLSVSMPASSLQTQISVLTDPLVRQLVYAVDPETATSYTPAVGDSAFGNWWNYTTGRAIPVEFGKDGKFVLSIWDYAPQLLGTQLEMQANYDSFRARPITPYSMLSKPKEQQYFASTPYVYRDLAKWASERNIPILRDFSPIEMDFMVSGYLATVGRQAAAFMSDVVGNHEGINDYGVPFISLTETDWLTKPLTVESLGNRGSAGTRFWELYEEYGKFKKRMSEAMDSYDAAVAMGDEKAVQNATRRLEQLEKDPLFTNMTKPSRRGMGFEQNDLFKEVQQMMLDYSGHVKRMEAKGMTPEEIQWETTKVLIDVVRMYEGAKLEK